MCWTAVMERGVSGGGTIALLWHGVVVPLLWFDTAEICGECVGGCFVVLCVFGTCLGDGSLAKRVA